MFSPERRMMFFCGRRNAACRRSAPYHVAGVEPAVAPGELGRRLVARDSPRRIRAAASPPSGGRISSPGWGSATSRSSSSTTRASTPSIARPKARVPTWRGSIAVGQHPHHLGHSPELDEGNRSASRRRVQLRLERSAPTANRTRWERSSALAACSSRSAHDDAEVMHDGRPRLGDLGATNAAGGNDRAGSGQLPVTMAAISEKTPALA